VKLLEYVSYVFVKYLTVAFSVGSLKRRLKILVPTAKHDNQGYRSRDRVRGSAKELGTMETYKNTKKSLPICLFLLSNNVDLKNNNRNYRKPLRIFWVRE